MRKPVEVEYPLRVMILGACREDWYSATDEERDDIAVPALRGLIGEWQRLGLEIIDSFDDDYLLVGQPGSLPYSFFILAKAPTFELVPSLMEKARHATSGTRPDRYFRFEARIGRQLFLLSS